MGHVIRDHAIDTLEVLDLGPDRISTPAEPDLHPRAAGGRPEHQSHGHAGAAPGSPDDRGAPGAARGSCDGTAPISFNAQFVRHVVSARPAPGHSIARVYELTKFCRLTLIGVLCSSVAALGCGSDTIDDAALEEEIKKDLAADAGVTPKAIDCPADIETQAGNRFECIGTAPSNDERFRISVKLTDDDGGFSAFVPPEQFEPDAR
jgi:Domain of unknown function (DUF4333)